MVDKKMVEIDSGTKAARDEMMARLIQLAKEEIKGERKFTTGPRGGKVWDKATPDAPPMNRSGDLRRSIDGVKSQLGFAHYYAMVGPQTVYARRLELGGGKWPAGLKFPYMEPAFIKFQEEAQAIIYKHLG
jgi:hypothetical protein